MNNPHLMNKLNIIICAKNYTTITQALTSLEYELIQANDADDIIRYCENSSNNIVIVDAIENCITLREHSQSVPILVLTDNVDTALNAGADDCLLFHPTLLQKRTQALINTLQFNGYDSVPSMIHSIDKTGKILDVNTYWLTTLGYSKDEVLGKNITDFMSETSRQVAPRMIETFWKTGVLRNIAFRYVKKNGDMIEALVDSNLINSEQNLTVLRDITEIKQVENTLRDAQNELQSVLNAIPDTITVINRDGQYIRVVSTGNQPNSSNLDSLVGKNLHNILRKNDADTLLTLIQTTLDTQTIQHHEYDIKHNGTTYSQNVTISPIDNDEVVFVTRDISEQKLAEENVKTSEKRYRRLFKNATDAIFVIDVMSGKISDASPQASWLLGYPLETLIGMSIDQIESDEITIQQEVKPNYQDTNQLIIETQYKHLTGDMIDVQVNSRAIQEDGKLLLISFVRDISEHKRILGEIEHQKNIAEALLDTSNVLNTFSDLDAVLDNILQNVSRIMPHESANIMMIEDNVAHIVRHLGYDKAGLETDAITNIILPLDKTDNLRWVYENKKPLKIDDTHHSPLFKWVNITTSGYVQSLISAPIITNNEVIGFINVDSFQVNNFTAEQADQLMVFANQAAIAIQRASLVQKLHDYTSKLERRVSDRTRDLLRANKNLKNQILQRQLIEDKLEEERNLLRTLIDNIPDHIYIKNTEERIILANKSAIRDLTSVNNFDEIFLLSNSEIFGDRNWVKQHAKQDKQLLASGEPIINDEFVYYDDDDKQHWLLVSKIPITDSQNEIMGFIGINRDVTDLKNAEILLSDERNMLRLIIDTIPDAIYVKNKQGQFLLANTATSQHIVGISGEADLIGKTDADLYPEISNRLIQEEQNIIQTGERQVNKSEVYYNDDGSVTHLLVTKLPLRDSHDNIRGVIGINHNISELRQAEAQLKQVLESARCLVWSATVTQIGTKQYEWDYRIANEEAAQKFLPIQTNNASYTDAWLKAIPNEEQSRREIVFETHLEFNKMDYRLEYFMNISSDETIWLHEDVIIEKIDDKRWHLVGVCTDITSRKQAEIQLKNLNNELESRVAIRTQELTQQVMERENAEEAERYQRVVAEAITASVAKLSSSLDRKEIFDHLLDSIHSIVPYDAANIMLIEDEGVVVVVHARGYEKDVLGIRYNIHDLSNFQRPHEEKKPQIINDVEQFQAWQDRETITWVKSNLSVPIIIDNTVIGIINLDSKMLNYFTEEQARWIMTFGEQAGIAIRNARYTAELEERVRERTLDLEIEQAQLSAILNGMTDGVIYTGMDRKPQYINQALVNITGFSQEEWLDGRAQAGVNIEPQKHLNIIWDNILAWLETHDFWRGETEFARKDGSIFNAGMVRTTVRNKQNETIGIVTVMRDISDDKRLQEQKAQFISIAAHELRTPIANMKTRLFLIKRRPEKLQEHLAVAESVVNLMQNLVEHMFDLSRFERGIIEIAPEPVNLKDLLTEVIQYQAPEAERQEISLKLDMPVEPIIISADPFRLTQVIINLIGNALNYTPQRSEISITLSEQDKYIVISFKDNGDGIAQEHLPNLFQPFYRASDDHKGAGLGLAIVSEIVKAHQGEVSVESEINKGTIFHIRLPIEQTSLEKI